jgi:hypothetical protein
MTFANNANKFNKFVKPNNANKISYRIFNSYANRSEDFENVSKIPRNLKMTDNNADNCKKIALKYKDARLSYKNRRNINKDWKDFNNQSVSY